MHQALFLSGVVLFSAILSWLLCGLVRDQLIQGARLDHPNERSLHTAPVPRGGGLGLWLAFLLMMALILGVFEFFLHSAIIVQTFFWVYAPLLFGIGLLAAISWRDDMRPLSPLLRISVQTVAVLLGLFSLPDAALFQGLLPLWLDRTVLVILWLWFINLTNFMDGMDGLTGAEAAHLSLGTILIFAFTAPAITWLPMMYPVLLLGTITGFLLWNWPPAKLFLGDVGSIPIGYLLGYFMLSIALQGYPGIALALPAYYLADATLTLIRRMLEGKKFWQAHREHFYQRAALKIGHKPVLFAVISANFVILGLCMASLKAGAWQLIGVPLVVALLLWYLNSLSKRA